MLWNEGKITPMSCSAKKNALDFSFMEEVTVSNLSRVKEVQKRNEEMEERRERLKTMAIVLGIFLITMTLLALGGDL